ncbi:MAG: hypothetical protein ABI768_13285 [Acidobacteriota bacterium]
MALALDSASKARILDFVRPLCVGLDGMTNYGFVERRMKISEILFEGEERRGSAGGDAAASPALLFLLAAFAGLPSARRITPDSRESLLLRSLRIPLEEISLLSFSLSRLESSPQTLEEKIVHDAMLLEGVGAYGVTQILVSGSRERMTLAEMADAIDAKMDGSRFATETGRRLAGPRIAYAKDFAANLRAEAKEFEAPACGSGRLTQ